MRIKLLKEPFIKLERFDKPLSGKASSGNRNNALKRTQCKTGQLSKPTFSPNAECAKCKRVFSNEKILQHLKQHWSFESFRKEFLLPKEENGEKKLNDCHGELVKRRRKSRENLQLGEDLGKRKIQDDRNLLRNEESREKILPKPVRLIKLDLIVETEQRNKDEIRHQNLKPNEKKRKKKNRFRFLRKQQLERKLRLKSLRNRGVSSEASYSEPGISRVFSEIEQNFINDLGKHSDNQGKSAENHGKSIKSQKKIAENQGKSAENHGKSIKSQRKFSETQGKPTKTHGISLDNQGNFPENQGKLAENMQKSSKSLRNSIENQGVSAKNQRNFTDNQGKSTQREGKSTENPGKSTKTEGKSSPKPASQSSSNSSKVVGSHPKKYFGVCNVCQRSFQSREDLLQHMKTHEKEPRVRRKSKPRKTCSCCCGDDSPHNKIEKRREFSLKKRVHWGPSAIFTDDPAEPSNSVVNKDFPQLFEDQHVEDMRKTSISGISPENNKLKPKPSFTLSTPGVSVAHLTSCYVKLQISAKIRKILQKRKELRNLRRKSIVRGNYFCKDCDKWFYKRKGLMKHRKEHEIQEKIAEEMEMEEDSESSSFRREESQPADSSGQLEEEQQPVFRCNLCDKEFGFPQSLLSHYMFAHAGGNKRKPLKILN